MSKKKIPKDFVIIIAIILLLVALILLLTNCFESFNNNNNNNNILTNDPTSRLLFTYNDTNKLSNLQKMTVPILNKKDKFTSNLKFTFKVPPSGTVV